MKVTKHFCLHYYSSIFTKEKIETFETGNPVYTNFIVVERNNEIQDFYLEERTYLFNDHTSSTVDKDLPSFWLPFFVDLTCIFHRFCEIHKSHKSQYM